ncbi:MAG: leucine-rich repeat protein [Alistipes sp.]|nr:leucine-rich repeat protein [Alistipes sp.]
MKKVKNILLLLTAIFTLGCSQTIVFEDIQTPTPTPTPKPEPEPDFDSSSYIDLSAEGTANCYLVKAAGKYKLKAVKGNSTQSVGAASSATVLWESFGTSTKPNEGDLIASATYKDGYVYFATPNTFKNGNASIAVRDSNAKILWSWHIWLSKEGWNDHVYANNAGTMMDRNLGATSATPGDVGAFGLLYQWGRKDPFLGSGATSGTTIAESTGAWNIVTVKRSIDYTIENPMTFIGGPGEWCSTEDVSDYARRWNDSVKTMHDPCPVGYRVPDGGETGFWATAHTGSTWDSTNKGRNWSLPDGTTAWYPATGYRDLSIGSLRLVGYSGDYWSASPYPSDPSYSCLLSFGEGDSNIATANRINRGFGYSVRCVSTTATSNPNPEPTEPANNEIWYTSTDGKVVTPAETGYFNVSITSNTYSNGKGVITFSGPLTTVGRDKGEEPFLNCANLKSVVLPNGLKTIGYGAFSLCSGLESVTIPETVTYIKSGAFYDCDKLTAIALPSGLLRIDDNAFFSCDLVESVTIPDSVTLIGRGAFSGEKLRAFYGKYASSDNKLIVFDETVICAALGGLTEYSIPNVVKIIDYCAFSGYKNIKKFTIPNSVVSIGDGSFSYCTSLQDITIPDSVTEIVGGSFFNCTSLTSAILSKNLTKIGDATFMNCSKLKNIYCSAVTPPQCGKDLFEGVTTDFKIYVPASSVSAYKSASGWSTYADAIVADPASTPDLDYSTATDLSAEGTANCYLVKAAGTYKFKAVKGNSTQSVGAASSADVLWESFGTSTTPNVGDLIASATYKDGYVYFATPTTFKSGNASIAVRDSSGTILWSWHIWCSTEGWKDDIYPNNAGTMMDRNLGATSATPGSVGALGLMYQWGRKDPFLGSSSVSSSTLAVSTGTWSSVTTQQTVDYVTANPMTFVRQNYEWCTGDGAEDSNYEKRWTESEKSMYDPCPVGYRVPDGGKNGFWATALGTSSSTTAGITWYSTYYGCLWTLSDGKLSAWYPIVGCRDTSGGALGNVGSIGYYWSASTHASDGECAYYLCFYDSKVSTTNYVNRCLGQSVRCVSTTATSEPTPGITSAPYAVGDYYNDGTKKGVVFEVSADGTSGKIVSMMQSTDTLQWSSDETEQKRLIGADSETDGAANMAVVKAISGWESKYPAFKWCADLGDGWYLPAKEELLTIYNNKDKLNTNLTNKLSSIYYWSSTEYDDQLASGQFRACSVNLGSGTYRSSKYLDYYVRAVTTF